MRFMTQRTWIEACWPDKLDLVAIDGKTSRRSHNLKTGHKALHLVSAFATNSREHASGRSQNRYSDT